jgi:hypothetical protein
MRGLLKRFSPVTVYGLLMPVVIAPLAVVTTGPLYRYFPGLAGSLGEATTIAFNPFIPESLTKDFVMPGISMLSPSTWGQLGSRG